MKTVIRIVVLAIKKAGETGQTPISGILSSWVAMLLLFFAHSANAQIVYQDISPDLSGATLNETVLGQNFQWSMMNGNEPTFSSSSTDPLIMVAPNQGNMILRLSQGDTIGPASTWNVNASNGPSSTIVSVGKYLGFRVGTPGNYLYGWFKIDVNSISAQWVVKSYAYEQTLNKFILAGDIGGGGNNDSTDNDDIAVTGIMVDGQGGVATVSANGGMLQMIATITPANVTHQEVDWSVQNGTGTATISTTGMLTAQTAGTVTVKAVAQDDPDVSDAKIITISAQPVGITAINMINGLSYPNPVRDQLIIQFSKEESISDITIRNITGQVVYKNTAIIKGEQMRVRVDFLRDGLYVLTYRNTVGKQGLQKFIKMK